MKSTDRKLAYSVVVVLTVIAAEVAWLLFVGPTDNRPNYAATCEKDCSEPWWQSIGVWTMIFTGVLTGSTALLWKETRRLAQGADDQLKITQRAYLNAEGMGTKMLSKKPNSIISDILIHNSGHLPAKNVAWLIDQKFSDNPRLADFPVNRAKAEGNNVIPPGASMLQGSPIFSASVEDFEPKDGALYRYLYVWGAVFYDAGFGGGEKTTKFCHRYNCANFKNGRISAEFFRSHRFGNSAN